MSSTISVRGSFIPNEVNTPLDKRAVVATLDDVEDMEVPYVGGIFYCVATGKHYKILTLKARIVGAIVFQNAAVDTYEELTKGLDEKVSKLTVEVAEEGGVLYMKGGITFDTLIATINAGNIVEVLYEARRYSLALKDNDHVVFTYSVNTNIRSLTVNKNNVITELGAEGNLIKSTTCLPAASSSDLGIVYLYTGVSYSTFNTGHYYICVLASDNYYWMDITPTYDNKLDAPEVEGNPGDFLSLDDDKKTIWAEPTLYWDEPQQ